MFSSLNNDQIIFVTAGFDHTIRFWKPSTGQCYKILQHNDSQVNCMTIYHDKSLLATGGFQHVSIYDILSSNQQPIVSLEGISKNTVSIGFQDKGAWLYTAGEEKALKIWDIKSRHISCVESFNHNQPITCVALHPNQVEFVIGDEIGNIFKWDIRANKAEPLFQDNEPKCSIRSIAINSEGTMMAAVNNEGACVTWNVSGGFGDVPLRFQAREPIYHPHRRYALKCLFSPDSTILATSGADGTAKIWRTIDFSLVTECKDNQQRWVWDLAFTSDSRYLFTASSDKLARLWSVENGEIKKDYIGHQKPIVCLAFSDSRLPK